MSAQTFYIGHAAKLAGTTVKAIRHYEEIGLLPQVMRQGKYRVYSEEAIEIIRFIKCAQTLGFKLKELESILKQYDGELFPWNSILEGLRFKKNTLLAEIHERQDLYQKLDSFEAEIIAAKMQCPLDA